jgi:DNA polymerase
MLAAIGVDRSSSAFIANVLKCRPPRNRDPLPDEVAACAPWLSQQIRAIDPRVILVVGRIAARALLGTESSLASLRGTVHRVSVGDRDIPVVVTYHPAYLLRSLPDKARAWADLSLARQVFEST